MCYFLVCFFVTLAVSINAYGSLDTLNRDVSKTFDTTSVVVQKKNSEKAGKDTLKYLPKSKLDSLSTGQTFFISLVAPSFYQIVNRQYYKIPIVIGGITGFVIGGWQSNVAYVKGRNRYQSLLNEGFSTEDPMMLSLQKSNKNYQVLRNWLYVGAGLTYIYGLLDGAYFHQRFLQQHSPTKAAIYSFLVPGLGQLYNQRYWKIPIVYTLYGLGIFMLQQQQFRYKLFSDAYNQKYELEQLQSKKPEGWEARVDELTKQLGTLASRPSSGLQGSRNNYRRQRDYWIFGMALIHLVNVVDAAVDAHFFDYDVSDNLSIRFTPQMDLFQYGNMDATATVGLGCNITF